jgi:hypothetical protein
LENKDEFQTINPEHFIMLLIRQKFTMPRWQNSAQGRPHAKEILGAEQIQFREPEFSDYVHDKLTTKLSH